ncbi:MAG: STAS domain-containing protein [Armatimonadetes bacterium]|nr:STAS domain-containing protein [Armatimonadota bacterium]
MLKCELVELSEAVVLELHGEIDLGATMTFRRYLGIAASCQKPILLDMKHLQYIDSAGARVIEMFLPQAWDQAGPVAIISPAPMLRRGLQLLEVDRQVPLFGSVGSALAWLRTSPLELDDEPKQP